MEKLYQLIKSLNGMEKRYFRLAVSVHKESEARDYMRVFDALQEQEQYDEKDLRAVFKGEKILRRFDMTKNYLYSLLLNTLQNYHKRSSKEQIILNLLDQAVILHNKTLYKSCRIILFKALKLAKTYEYYELQLKAIQLKISIDEKTGARSSARLHEEYNLVLQHIRQLGNYRTLYHLIYTFFSDHGNDVRDKTIKKQYQDFLRHPLLVQEAPSAYKEKGYYFLSLGLCHFCLGDALKSYNYTQKHFALITKDEERIKEDPDTYITVLNSIIFYGSVLSRIKESDKAFNTLSEFLSRYPAKRHKLFIAYDNMMALYITSGRFSEGLMYADKAAEELEEYEHSLFSSNKVALYHDMSYIYFGCGKYDRSLEWLNKLLNEKAIKVREDIQVTARLINLILHYELKHFDLLPYLVKSTINFLRKRKGLRMVEQIFLKYMKRLLNVSPGEKEETIRLFKEIRSEVEKVVRHPDEAKVLTEYFDYLSWLDSKIKGRSFERVVRDKN
jgi:tetratricopeptide (TPR) repeat protein